MLPQSYIFSHGLCLDNFLQVWFIVKQIYKVPPFRYINWADEVAHLIKISKVLGGMKYLMRSVKQAAEAVGIWTEENRYMKRVN